MSNYQTATQVDTYFSTRVGSFAWDDAVDADKNKAVAHATWIIDQLEYKGEKSVSTQVNKFPRNGNSTPQAILNAHSEICNALIDGVDIEKEFIGMGGMSSTYANVKFVKQQDSFQEHIRLGIPSISAYRLLAPYMLGHKNIKLNRTS